MSVVPMASACVEGSVGVVVSVDGWRAKWASCAAAGI